ncbi:HDOD domain-containing protein [Helicobacter saguini]|uniref:HDOD domain-containing protein n=1 Tax=Helicobacter saguini TaxID=1548018 RepID=A0A347VN96_9HELI|nr:HDOD domain-containing protein [Helicobacter saguini]MWV61850.1 HDOD domain-containing protein [Helicobacter saguini]MWV67475.1 HDOD domain-containing protein [Helicobacter saguini]MWV69826.1 HDOD domain-containing protein [Helicobacter saguini]MWV72956.1 HDOD domain-containing protein [Helicobacter saguini]TLD95661.1 HDOD domain-containing protein [Helicobacter saguini]
MMNELLDKTIENLPPLPETVIKLRSYIDGAGSEVRIQEVVNIISQDPLLTADLLRLANSPYYGFSREISTINQVVALLGVTNIKNIAIANSLKGKLNVNVAPYGLDTPTFLRKSSEEVNFITEWLGEEDKKLSQELVPCAMLMRLGMILFSSMLIQQKKDKEFLELIKQNNYKNISFVENEFFGTDHLSFSGFLFNYWKFDEDLIESLAYITAPHAASDHVKKNSYALAIANRVFEPYEGGNPYNMHEAVALIQEAATQGIRFDVEKFKEKLPHQALINLQMKVE